MPCTYNPLITKHFSSRYRDDEELKTTRKQKSGKGNVKEIRKKNLKGAPKN
jgi:hypothetical protein